MSNFQCILCKYKNDETKCMEAIQNTNFECSSLSNTFYGKIIKIPIIKQIYKICDKIRNYYLMKKYEKEYIDEYETQDMKYIWGVQSYDDLSDTKSTNLYTMNDIDLIYLKDEDKYIIGLETVYMFKEEKIKLYTYKVALKYLQNLWKRMAIIRKLSYFGVIYFLMVGISILISIV